MLSLKIKLVIIDRLEQTSIGVVIETLLRVLKSWSLSKESDSLTKGHHRSPKLDKCYGSILWQRWKSGAFVSYGHISSICQYLLHLYIFHFQAALNMITKNLTIDLQKEGILVAAIHPGWVKTFMGGPGAFMEISDSVQSILKVIASIKTVEDGGKFYHYTGRVMAWWNSIVFFLISFLKLLQKCFLLYNRLPFLCYLFPS